jgi:hypothetical protein
MAARYMHEVGPGDYIHVDGEYKEIAHNPVFGTPDAKDWCITTIDGCVYGPWDIDLYAKRNYTSKRGLPLVYYGQPPEVTTVTVENYCKWYTIALVHPDGAVEEVPFPEDLWIEGESPFVDHVPNPRYVAKWARAKGYAIDEVSMDLMVGRWELDRDDGDRYSLIYEEGPAEDE